MAPSPLTWDVSKPAAGDTPAQYAGSGNLALQDKITLSKLLGTLAAFGTTTTAWRENQQNDDSWLAQNAVATSATAFNRDDTLKAALAHTAEISGPYFRWLWSSAAANPITNWLELMRLTPLAVPAPAGALGVSQLSLGVTPALTGQVRFSAPGAAPLAAARNFANTADVNLLGVSTTGSDYAQIAASQSLTLGLSAPAVGATTGFPYLPAIAGVPTGVPTAITGYAPAVVDSTDSRLYFYSGGAWQNTTNVVFVDQQTVTTDNVNTTTDFTLYTVSIPQNTLTAGRSLLVYMWGDILNNAAGGSPALRIKLGATTLFLQSLAFTANDAVRCALWVDFRLFAIASNSQVAWVWHTFNSQASAPAATHYQQGTWSILNSAHTSVGMNASTENNGAGATVLTISAQWPGPASANLSVRSLGVKTVVIA
jgi:hypothetical protein